MPWYRPRSDCPGGGSSSITTETFDIASRSSAGKPSSAACASCSKSTSWGSSNITPHPACTAAVYSPRVPDVSELLAAYDTQLRDRVPARLPTGVRVEQDGPLVRFLGFTGGGFVCYRDLGGLDGAELDALIARQVDVFAAREERFEWKLHGHDLPTDLPERLRAAGFTPEEVETVEIAPVDAIAVDPLLPG